MLILLVCSLTMSAQTNPVPNPEIGKVVPTEKVAKANAVRTADGNFTSLAKITIKDSATAFVYTGKDGVSLPVFQNSKGKYFLSRVSKKTGKRYRYYLKTE